MFFFFFKIHIVFTCCLSDAGEVLSFFQHSFFQPKHATGNQQTIWTFTKKKTHSITGVLRLMLLACFSLFCIRSTYLHCCKVSFFSSLCTVPALLHTVPVLFYVSVPLLLRLLLVCKIVDRFQEMLYHGQRQPVPNAGVLIQYNIYTKWSITDIYMLQQQHAWAVTWTVLQCLKWWAHRSLERLICIWWARVTRVACCCAFVAWAAPNRSASRWPRRNRWRNTDRPSRKSEHHAAPRIIYRTTRVIK